MASIHAAVNTIKGDALALVKDELKSLLTSAKNDAIDQIRETGEKIATWLVMRAKGELTDDEFQSLLYARDQLLRQFKNTASIEAKARTERVAVGLVNLVLDKIIGIAF